MKNVLLIVGLFLISSFTFSQTNPILEVKSLKLDNGFTILLNEDSTATKVFGAVMVNAGSRNESPEATGMAHYLEHLLFKGTTKMGTLDYEKEKPYLDSIRVLYDELGLANTEEERAVIQKKINVQAGKAGPYGLPNEFDRLLKSIGGTGINAFTTKDMTFYHNSFPAHEVEKWLDIYATRFEEPVFRSFQSELEVVYEEKNRSMDDFGGQIFEEIQRMLFPNTPYGEWPVLGTIEHLKSPPLNKMYEFYETNYVAGNMALILVGNFDSEVVVPMIKKRFGKMPAQKAPPVSFDNLPRLEGETVVKRRMTPVKLEVLGYRTVPKGHPDRLAMDVCEYLLYNETETGFFNQMEQNGDIMFAGSFSLNFEAVGATLIFFVPKILIQSLGNAEKKVEAVFDRVKKGDFSDEMLIAAQNDLSNTSQRSLENVTRRGITIGGAFNTGTPWEDVLNYPERVRKVNREEVMRVANTYLGNNRIKFISKTGFPKKTKLTKPDFEAAVKDQKGESTYSKSFEQLSSLPFKPRYIDFNKDVGRAELPGGHQVYSSPNPVNDLFTLNLRFKTGNLHDPMKAHAAELMNYSGAGEYSLQELKRAFAGLGCSYTFSAWDNYVNVGLEGQEANLGACLDLVNLLLTDPRPTEQSRKLMVNAMKVDRKFEKRTPSVLGTALAHYARYGEQSTYLTRPIQSDLKKVPLETSVERFTSITQNYECEVVFIGQKGAKDIAKLIDNRLALAYSSQNSELPLSSGSESADKSSMATADPYVYREGKTYTENTVLFVDDKKAIQSQVYFYVQGGSPRTDQYASISGFNSYFGGGFSGLVLQEIREYRSLAYTAWGSYRKPGIPGKKGQLLTHVGCQADKTLDVIEVMHGLITDLPEKSDRMPSLRENLGMKVITDFPDFKNLPYYIINYKRMGYTQDPNIAAYPAYAKLEMKDLSTFHAEQIKDRPIVITVYGDKRKIDMEALKKYGVVKELKLEEVIRF